MKKADMVLTYPQAKELKFFCQSVIGTRQEFYTLLDKMLSFKQKIDRMHTTCELIEKYLGEQIKEFASFKDEDKTPKQKGGEG